MVKKQFRRHNAVGNVLVRKFLFRPMLAKIQLFKFMDVHFGVILARTLLKNLYGFRKLLIMAHSNDLLMTPDTPARVWHPQIFLRLDEQSNN